MKRVVPSVFVVVALAAACGNDASMGHASGGSSGVGGTAAFSDAPNNLSSGGLEAASSSIAGASAWVSGGSSGEAGGSHASGGTGETVGGSLGCGGTLTLGSITAADLYGELAQGSRTFLLINVHTPVSGHIPGTDADIEYTDIAAIERSLGPNKAQAAVLYCMTDYMSSVAGPLLVADGYCHVRALAGGMNAWRSAGYTVAP